MMVRCKGFSYGIPCSREQGHKAKCWPRNMFHPIHNPTDNKGNPPPGYVMQRGVAVLKSKIK